MVGLKFKTLVEAATRNAESAARRTYIATIREVARMEIKEKMRLLSSVLFDIDGLSNDEALMMLRALAKDEVQLTEFWVLSKDKKLYFCRIFLSTLPHHPSSV